MLGFCFVFLVPIYNKPHETCAAVTCYKLDLIGLFSTIVTSFLKPGIIIWKIIHILISAIDRNTFTENQNVGALCLPLYCLWTTTLTNGYLTWLFKKQSNMRLQKVSLLDVGLNMKLKIKLQKGMKWLENDSMPLYCFWENFILTWRWVLFSSDKA